MQARVGSFIKQVLVAVTDKMQSRPRALWRASLPNRSPNTPQTRCPVA
jgi:hypothetical protein